ncbi:PP2C family protein-serine/threonine phosphatase [Gracilimonas sp.]|uniref:PP2C family protein-serine/threonine phosphatase n=1 Tax=Gracilimonas sp. TaxID=1974203 RepID=UPI002870FBF6|nr:SpoIIE family protein phosphatase [Gracilimonas sp.]
MLNKKSYILILCGLAGLLIYILLRPEIEFYANGPIEQNRKQVDQKITEIAQEIGFSADSLAIVTMRRQHLSYVETIRDSANQNVTPAKLNNRGLHTQSWETVLGEKNGSSGVFATLDQLFEDTGQLKVNVSNSGQIIRLNSHPENTNPTFLTGDSLFTIAEYLVGDVFGYNLGLYNIVENNVQDSLVVSDEGQNSQRLLDNGGQPNELEITWKLKEDSAGLPQTLTLSLEPVVREFDNQDIFRTEFGYSINSFAALGEYEPVDLSKTATMGDDDGMVFTYLFFISVFVLGILIFSVGIRNIFKGKVEWRRALFIFVTIAAGVYGWRAIFFIYSFNPFLTNTGVFGSTINSLLFGLAVGLYAAFAYISWEALARSQKEKQVDIIDALWQRKFFVSETGTALVHGFAFGGIVIGIISSMLFLMGEFLLQGDSQFGYTEASIAPKLLTINMSTWTTTWLVCIAQIGFVYTILRHWVKKEWLSSILAILISGICITVLGRLFSTSGTFYQDLVIFVGVAIVFIYALREYGLLTVCTGWWVFSVFFMIQPYVASPDLNLAYVGWVQAFIMAGPLIYGFIAYRYGVSVSEVGDYIPEYEERIAQHLRVEKEIEIARESQFKLMPLQPPKAEGFEVYGFFMPSFEVGGDYFDYLLTKDETDKPSALTMSVVDVSGKAMQAAMPAVFTSGLLLSRMKHDCPDEVLSEISEPIFHRTDKRTFITCVMARYDLETRQMAIANAGHCRPILKRNGIAEYIHTPNPSYPLGLREKVEYKQELISMKEGDFFLLYSDGLPEAVNEKGERFGFDEVPRLIESIDTDKLSAKEIAQEIKRTVQKFSNYQLADDTTIICLKV